MTELPFSLKLDADTKQRLDREAELRNLSADEIAGEAIQSYLRVQEFEREVLRERLAEADKGVFISGEAMHRWIASWGTDNELSPPEPDVFLAPRK